MQHRISAYLPFPLEERQRELYRLAVGKLIQRIAQEEWSWRLREHQWYTWLSTLPCAMLTLEFIADGRGFVVTVAAYWVFGVCATRRVLTLRKIADVLGYLLDLRMDLS